MKHKKGWPRADAISFIERTLQTRIPRGEPGLAVAVMQGGKTVWQHSVGLASVEFGVPIDVRTRFRLASISKQMAATVVLKLVDEGLIALDDQVRRFLPEASHLGSALLIRHLLNMSSGLHEVSELGFLARGDLSPMQLPTAEYRRLVLAQPDLAFEPGALYRYNNGNYILLEWICERVSGKQFHALLDEHLFVPLGMHDTQLPQRLDEVPVRMANGYQQPSPGKFDPVSPWRNTGAAGGVISTLQDMQRWQSYLHESYQRPEGVAERLMSWHRTPDGQLGHYGFGLMRGVYGDRAWVGHAGGLSGFSTDLIWFAGEDLAVLVLANRDDFKTMRLTRWIADQLLDGKSVLDSYMAPVGPTASSADKHSMVGTYVSPAARRVIAIEQGSDPRLLTCNQLLFQTEDESHGHVLIGDAPQRFVVGVDGGLREIRLWQTVTELRPTKLSKPTLKVQEEMVGLYCADWLDARWKLLVDTDRLLMATSSSWRHGERFELLQAAEDLFVMAVPGGTPLYGSVIEVERGDNRQVNAIVCHFDRTRDLRLVRQAEGG